MILDFVNNINNGIIDLLNPPNIGGLSAFVLDKKIGEVILRIDDINIDINEYVDEINKLIDSNIKVTLVSTEYSLMLNDDFLSNINAENSKDNMIYITEDIYDIKKSGFDMYDIETFKRINDTINELLADFDEKWTDLKKVIYVYQKLGEILPYNELAKLDNKNFDPKLQKKCSSLESVLDENGAVCAGYTCCVKAILNKIGIDCEIIEGYAAKSSNEICFEEEHVWNIVKINYYGEMVPVQIDLTWDAKNCLWGEMYQYFGSRYFDWEHVMDYDYMSLAGERDNYKYISEIEIREILYGFDWYEPNIVFDMGNDDELSDEIKY